MQFDNVIYERRSIRKFTSESVSDDEVKEIIRAGIAAPSAKNAQPWRFVVIRKEETEDLCKAMEAFHDANPQIPNSIMKTAQVMREASACILVFMPPRIEQMQASAPWQFLIPDISSVGACFENMTLKAHDMGLGSLWICDVLFARDYVMEHFDTDWQVAGALSVGHAGEKPDARPRKPFDEIVTFIK